MLNSKVNNWAIEISPFHITFEYIKGIKNTLADTMSQLIDIDPQIQQNSEPEGYKFGYYTFDTLPAVEVSNIETTQDTSENDKIDSDENFMELPLDNDILFELQQKDAFCASILAQIEKGNVIKGQVYKVQNKLLKRYVTDMKLLCYLELLLLKYLRWHMITWDIMGPTEPICYLKGYITGKV